jgi:chromatin remodeling complex protein RSC6
MSEQLQAFTGQQQLKRTEIVKAIWDYIKANNLQVGRPGHRVCA